MQLSLTELNEVLYCLGRVIADDPKGWNAEIKQAVYNKLYAELEDRVKTIESMINQEQYK